jgi:hypothetical protein
MKIEILRPIGHTEYNGEYTFSKGTYNVMLWKDHVLYEREKLYSIERNVPKNTLAIVKPDPRGPQHGDGSFMTSEEFRLFLKMGAIKVISE